MKGKKNKKHLADRVASRPTVKTHNPFEVRVNRKKHNVLGQRSKNEKGLPGIARSRALKKRKATLLQEYKLKGKSNMFVDRRIGEKDKTMTLDDKITARYTTERMQFHSKKSLYNLDDNEVLTHRGESLADIEKFEDPLNSDEDDEDGRDKSGKLGEDFVSEAHFGGGILRKVDGEIRSRKDLIDQMIAESKIRKADQQQLREQTLNLTEKLDTQWNEIAALIHSSKPREEGPTLPSDKKYASYDKLSKELKFEARGKATDKLKSEKERAEEEKKKLEEFEQQRLARMLGDDVSRGPKHRSADDLDDEFDFKSGPKSKERVHYMDELNEVDFKRQSSESESSDEEMNDDNETVKADDEVDIEAAEHEGDEDEEESAQSSDSDDDNYDNDDNDDNDDDLSDLKEDSEDDYEDVSINKSATKKSVKATSTNKKLENLPLILAIPESYDDFSKMCFGHAPTYLTTVLERMIKPNLPSAGGSRAKLVNLYKYCLQYLQETSSDPSSTHNSFIILDQMAPWLFDLVSLSPAVCISILCDTIKEKYAEYSKATRRFPGIDTLVFFKLVSVLFTTSDFRHRVVTPTLVFMQQILATCRIRSSVDVATGLFVTTLILEFTAVSKRLTPEALNFIKGCLRSALPKESSLPTVQPFTLPSNYSLHVPSSSRLSSTDLRPLTTKDLTAPTNDGQFKLSAVNLAVKLLDNFTVHFQNAEHVLILQPFEPLLQSVNFVPCLHSALNAIIERLSTLKEKKLYKLMAEKKRPKPLRLYEPQIEEVYTFRKKKSVNPEKDEKDKLMYKYKKEVKGALREIRRDNAFLSKLKFTETKASDLERKRKVKEILGDAAQQAGDLNKLKRSK